MIRLIRLTNKFQTHCQSINYYQYSSSTKQTKNAQTWAISHRCQMWINKRHNILTHYTANAAIASSDHSRQGTNWPNTSKHFVIYHRVSVNKIVIINDQYETMLSDRWQVCCCATTPFWSVKHLLIWRSTRPLVTPDFAFTPGIFPTKGIN